MASAVSELTRDSYELLLANSLCLSPTTITILTQSHPIKYSDLPRSRVNLVTLEEEIQ